MTIRPTFAMSLVLVGISTILGLPAAMAAREAASQPQQAELTIADCNPMDLGFGSSQWLYPLEGSKEKLVQAPKLKSAKPVYYAAVFGDAADNVYTFVIDESGGTGKGYDTLHFDADNDNRIGDGETISFRMSTVRKEEPVRLKLQVRAGKKTYPYWVSFTAFPHKDEKDPVEKIHANLRNASYRTGQAVICGKSHKIALADLNSNGMFNDPECSGSFSGDRFFVDLNDDGKFKYDKGEDGENGFGCGAYTRIAGRWYSIVASPCGDRVTISEASPPLGQVKAPAMVAEARLGSAKQMCVLRFKDGLAEGVAGTYELMSVALAAKDASGRQWGISGRFRQGRPKVSIKEGQKATLPAVGPVLQVAPTISCGEDGSLAIGLRITGLAGEEYSWPRGVAGEQTGAAGGGGVKPGFEIRDAAGKVVDSGTFEYG